MGITSHAQPETAKSYSLHCFTRTKGSNHEQFASAIMLTVVTLLFMPTTSQPTPSDQPHHTDHPEGTRGPSSHLQEEIKKEIIDARRKAIEAINGMTSLLANMLTPIVKIIQTESMFSEKIEHMRERQGGGERDEDKLWEAKDKMMEEVLMEE